MIGLCFLPVKVSIQQEKKPKDGKHKDTKNAKGKGKKGKDKEKDSEAVPESNPGSETTGASAGDDSNDDPNRTAYFDAEAEVSNFLRRCPIITRALVDAVAELHEESAASALEKSPYKSVMQTLEWFVALITVPIHLRNLPYSQFPLVQ